MIKPTAKTLIDRVDAQADLRLRWEHRSFCWFSHADSYTSAMSFIVLFYCILVG